MSLRNFFVTILIAVLSLSHSEGAGTVSVSVTPAAIKEFTSFRISCHYPLPGVNASTTGVLQVTHVTPSSTEEIIYRYNFDVSSETISSNIQARAMASVNKTVAVIVIDVQVAYVKDTGTYGCSLADPSANSTMTATPAAPLTVTGCVDGSQLDRIVGCPSVSVGMSCSVFCNSSIANSSVSLSRSISGSPQIASGLEEVNYTINSIQDSDFGIYYCNVTTTKCISMDQTNVKAAPVTTSAPGCVNVGGGCGGNGRLAGWKIALIVIACLLIFALIVALIVFFLHKKGILFKRDKAETGVHPTSGGQGRAVANDNYATSRAKSAAGKKEVNNSGAAAVVTFPEVKTRKSQLPPLEPITQGWNRRQTEENSSPDVAKRRPLPKRNDSAPSPETDRRRSQVRRHSDEEEGDSPERGGGRVPPIKISSSRRERDEDDEDHGRF